MTGLSKAKRAWFGLIAAALLASACSSSNAETSAGDQVDTAGADTPGLDEVDVASTDASDAAETNELSEITGAASGAVQPADDEDNVDEVVGERTVRTAAETAAALGRGINFGNMLEAPREGDWGASLDAQDFVTIAEAGFDHVRLPVSWAGYADTEAPYTIPDGVDETISHPDYTNIWDRVQWAIDQAEANDLMIIVNMHHYDEAHDDPAAHRDRIIAMWEQISARYADASDDVVFELFNEPNGQFTERPELWNELAADLVDVVRATNPTRKLLVGPVGFNHIDDLPTLDVVNDGNILATVHLYEPFPFTHQGADWIDPVPPLGVSWDEADLALTSGFTDRSWESTTSVDNGLYQVDYSRQWAGFALDWGQAEQPGEVRFTARASSPTSIQLGCQYPGVSGFDIERVQLSTDLSEYVVDLSACESNSTGIAMLNANTATIPVQFERIEMCTQQSGCRRVLVSAEQSLRGWLQNAAQWADETGVPVHLGEFGAFSGLGTVSLDERAAWTTTVANEATALGIPYSYWEYNGSFGAFAEDEGAWIPELQGALLQ